MSHEPRREPQTKATRKLPAPFKPLRRKTTLFPGVFLFAGFQKLFFFDELFYNLSTLFYAKDLCPLIDGGAVCYRKN